MGEQKTDRLRIDKWLWAARFFKTRSLAAHAVSGGKVQVGGERVKPSRPVAVGDRLSVRRGQDSAEVEVLVLSGRRGPARVAQGLYRETGESVARRAAQREIHRVDRAAAPVPGRRPDKRERRRHLRLERGE